MSDPRFAVVGHPNKGKSSLVAALAQDDSVAVGPTPGTTTAARHFPMRVDGRVLYTLVDTPGFQRARAVLQWLKQHATDAADRPHAVARFVDAHRGDPRFHDECELLAPIVEGAGILYVVDGAVPYSSEYDAEMDILRWTGQPSIAVINPIGDDRHVEDWSRALAQYFRIVRVLDALDAPFEKRLQVLSAFGELREDWRDALDAAARALRAEHQHRRHESAAAIADLIETAVTLTVERKLATKEATDHDRAELESRYRRTLRVAEQRCRKRVEALYRHERLERRETDMAPLDEDLFSRGSWLAFGLSRTALAQAGAGGGALAGLGIDVAAGGGSLFLGAAVGAAIGGVASWLSADRLAEVKIQRLSLGGQMLRYGPSRNLNLPFVLLGRARAHHAVVSGRSHAARDVLDLTAVGDAKALERADTDAFAKAFRTLGKSEPGSASRAQSLAAITERIERLLGS